MSGSPAWGSGAYGAGGWAGGGLLGPLQLVDAVAARENMLELRFTRPVYLSGLLDVKDGTDPTHWIVAVVTGTKGSNDEDVRAVNVIRVTPADIPGAPLGLFVDLWLDRPLTPWPSRYEITASGIWSSDGGTALDITHASLTIDGVFRELVPALNTPPEAKLRDIANPQTRSAAVAAGASNPDDPLQLGTFVADGTGDYGVEEGIPSFKKRVTRRLFSKRGAFAHLPDYGLGLPGYSKKLARAADISRLRSDAERQIKREPEVADARVRLFLSPRGLLRLVWEAKLKSGTSTGDSVDVPSR